MSHARLMNDGDDTELRNTRKDYETLMEAHKDLQQSESTAKSRLEKAETDHARLQTEHRLLQDQMTTLQHQVRPTKQEVDQATNHIPHNTMPMDRATPTDQQTDRPTDRATDQPTGQLSDQTREELSAMRASAREKEEAEEAANEKLVALQRKVDKARLDATELASAKAGDELREMRGELEKSMASWQTSEQTQRLYEESAKKLKHSLYTEQERATLFKAQVSLLEDQLRAASEELEVFRQLDVYKATLQREFETVRKHRNYEQVRL